MENGLGICAECGRYSRGKCSKGYKLDQLGVVLSCKDFIEK